jgi:hypothetical protein
MPILDRWMLGHFPGANPTSTAEFRVSQQVNWRFRAAKLKGHDPFIEERELF